MNIQYTKDHLEIEFKRAELLLNKLGSRPADAVSLQLATQEILDSIQMRVNRLTSMAK